MGDPPARPGRTGAGRTSVAVALAAVAAVGVVRGLEVLTGGFLPAGVLPVSTTLALVVAGAALSERVGPSRLPRTARHRLPRALLVGGLGVLGLQVGAHLLQVGADAVAGTPSVVRLAGINPVTGTERHLVVYLAVGVVLAALAEELLFRGVVLRSLSRRISTGRANAVQAGLFGLWHLAWPLALAVGPLEAPVALPILAVGTVLVTGLVGAVFGVLARHTGTLWTPIVAHVVHNGTAVFVHVRAGGVDRAAVLAPALVVGYVALAWAVRRRL